MEKLNALNTISVPPAVIHMLLTVMIDYLSITPIVLFKTQANSISIFSVRWLYFVILLKFHFLEYRNSHRGIPPSAGFVGGIRIEVTCFNELFLFAFWKNKYIIPVIELSVPEQKILAIAFRSSEYHEPSGPVG